MHSLFGFAYDVTVGVVIWLLCDWLAGVLHDDDRRH